MKRLYILAVGLTFFVSCQAQPNIETTNKIEIPQDSKQILKVTTPSWSSKNGTLQRYEKKDNKWQKVGEPISIILGRNGLGWGLGLHSIPKDAKYIKKEGDGKAPAGLFTLNNGFGYEPMDINFSYAVYTRDDHCVDDSNSIWYNKIINSKEVEKDYNSFEYMKRKDNLYRYGVVVNHNLEAIKYGGSCIFLHIRSGNGKGTAGCTAMSEDKIVKVLKWLKEDKKPLLLQLPIKEMKRVADDSLK